MCLIIDVNVVHTVYKPRDPDGAPILDWLQDRNGRLVDGGQLSKEFGKNKSGLRWLAGQDRAGRVIKIGKSRVRYIERQILDSHNIRSDDPHILALAFASGARLLYTKDKKLKKDFKNRNLIKKPPGKIYSGGHNASLLTKNVCKTCIS